MYHIAIMKKSWGLIPKIISGEKTIESRWYMNKYTPWDKIKEGDVVYFKNTGEPVTVRAEVAKVIQYEQLKPEKVKIILNKYGGKDGLGIDELDKYYRMFKNKRYCLLIFIKNPKSVKPFNINKSGFGTMAAWLTVNNINKLLIHNS